MRIRPMVFALAGSTLAAALTAIGLPAAQAAEPLLTAQIVQTSTWSSGYGADVIVSNGGTAAATTSWVVEFDLPAGTTVSSSWSSVRTQTGQHYRFTNVSYNGDIAPGQ